LFLPLLHQLGLEDIVVELSLRRFCSSGVKSSRFPPQNRAIKVAHERMNLLNPHHLPAAVVVVDYTTKNELSCK